MQVIVVKRFRDKYTNQRYRVGETFDVDEARLEELLTHEKGPLVAEMVDEIPAGEELMDVDDKALDEPPAVEPPAAEPSAAEPPAETKKPAKGSKSKSSA